MFNRKRFSEDLFMYRNSKGLSRATAAAEIGVKSATMQGLEEGTYDPRITNYQKVCKWMSKKMEFYFINN